jgi:hypothetical protein
VSLKEEAKRTIAYLETADCHNFTDLPHIHLNQNKLFIMKTNQHIHLLLRKLLMLIVSTLTLQVSRAQDTPYHKTVAFKIVVRNDSGNGVTEGYLHSISDTSVSLSANPVFFKGYSTSNIGLSTINYNKISYITIWRPGGAGRGILIGAIGGAALGAIGGAASGDDKSSANNWCILCLSAGQKAVGFGIVSGLVGGLVGGMVGTVAGHLTFNIEGKKEKFDEFKWKLMH